MGGMITSSSKPTFFDSRARRALVICCFLMVALTGCQKSLRVSDPQLQPIQDMLDAQVPTGSSQERVSSFLAARGYPIEPSEKTGTIVAIIRHIDTQRMQPVTARVTFYFDATNKLNTVEIIRTMNEPIH
jgi:hypothetical protein